MRKDQPTSAKPAAPSKSEASDEKSDTDEEGTLHGLLVQRLIFVPADAKALTAAESSLLTKVLRARLVVTKTNVEVLRQDPNSPLFSVKSFDELNL